MDSPALDRRTFLAAVAAGLTGTACAAPAATPRRLLLRSSWQTVNIGDIAHTPGMLALLEKHLPEVEVTLWPNKLSDDVKGMLARRFPKLRFAISHDEQARALDDCEFCLHGSGPGLVGKQLMAKWSKAGLPYGFGGVTLSDEELRNDRELLEQAQFVYCRDSLSLAALKATGVAGPLLEFGPDATFHLDLRNEPAADRILAEHQLERGKFACFVPRLRYTPYWLEGRKYEPEERAKREAINDQYRDADHGKLREAIVAWVRETKQRALLCPEMTYEVELLRPLLFDPLPDDVKPYVAVLPKYWLTDEAASTYARAAAVVSLEMHSPIIAIAGGVPAIHLREPTDTRKGQMWRDVGLGDWLFEIEPATGAEVAARLLDIVRQPELAQQRVAKARAFTAARGVAMMASIVAAMHLPPQQAAPPMK